MYMIKGTIGVGSETLYPAENCTFNTAESSDNKHYEVTSASFHDPAAGTTSTITNPVLGVISKTGRFTPITQ
jgi:hypothetical protein